MARSVIRHVTWTITQDVSATAPPPRYEMECTTCTARSAPTEDAGTAQDWALQHSGRHPSHTGYRGVGTSFWRTSMAGEEGGADVDAS